MTYGCLVAGLIAAAGPGSGVQAVEGQGKAVPPAKKYDLPLPVAESPRAAQEGDSAVGVREVPRPEGGKDKIYFSVTPESERRARNQAEKHKMERALDLPQNVIILGPTR